MSPVAEGGLFCTVLITMVKLVLSCEGQNKNKVWLKILHKVALLDGNLL